MAQIKWKTRAEIEEEKNKPIPPTKEELLEERISQQDMVIEELMFVILPELLGGGM